MFTEEEEEVSQKPISVWYTFFTSVAIGKWLLMVWSRPIGSRLIVCCLNFILFSWWSQSTPCSDIWVFKEVYDIPLHWLVVVSGRCLLMLDEEVGQLNRLGLRSTLFWTNSANYKTKFFASFNALLIYKGSLTQTSVRLSHSILFDNVENVENLM